MQIRICDRCGEQLEGGNYGLLTLIKKAKAVYDGIELCELCCDKVIDVLDLTRPETFTMPAAKTESLPTDGPTRRKQLGFRKAVRELFAADRSPKTLEEIRGRLRHLDSKKVTNAVHMMKLDGLLVRIGETFVPAENAA